MKKTLVTFLTKKENCGHAILDRTCLALDVVNPAISKQVKTADLYLLNANFKTTFDNLLEVARAKLSEIEGSEDVKDVQNIISELKIQTEVINDVSLKFSKVYRQTATAKEGVDIMTKEIELSVAKEVVNRDKKRLDELKANLKAHYMKEYGLI